mmetsp:Transcript_50795/g.151994  ORF Transcript_50795/g.151994 Transcript_50795/m.151994 type:complete len:256 (-) Transcript_50795:67-834(-)
MPALLVGLGAVGHLHHEGRPGAREVRQDLQVHGGPEVIGVGHKHVLEALAQELVERAAAEHRGVEVSVARRAPLVCRLLLPGGRRHVRGGDLRRLVLDELEVCARAELGVLGEGRQGVGGCRERVHEHERQVRLVRLLHRGNLLGDEVQEAVAAGDRQERLGLVQAHAGSQAAVELQDDSLLQQLRILLDGQFLKPGQAFHAVQCALGNHHIGARDKHRIVVLEGGNGCLVAALLLHLCLVGGPVLLHGGHLRMG